MTLDPIRRRSNCIGLTSGSAGSDFFHSISDFANDIGTTYPADGRWVFASVHRHG
jgi:hypothetical protein